MQTVTTRVRIATGLKCNIRCPFCYYGDELNTQEYAHDRVLRMMDLAWDFGVREIDFSGGEPTIRKDFTDLLAYAQTKGFKKICVITNGVRISSRQLLEQFHKAGLNEVLMSVHGGDDETASRLSGHPGMLAKLTEALDNVLDLGLRLRTNTVVNSANMKLLPRIARMIAAYKPVAVNFICFNDWINASPSTRDMAVRFSEASPLLKEAINILKKTSPKVTVRYIPFCLLEGYEPHVCGLLQNTFDGDEWLDSIKRLVTDIDDPKRLEDYKKTLNDAWKSGRDAMDAGLHAEERSALARLSGAAPFEALTPDNALAAHVVENYIKRGEYVKSPGCKQCSLDRICDGLHRSYADLIGTGELHPITGEPIGDSMRFR